MATCNKCGKGGLFFKVNLSGRCNECERIAQIQEEERQWQNKIAGLKDQERQLKATIAQIEAEFSATVNSFNEMKDNKDELYKEISERAKKAAHNELQDVIAQIEEKKNLLASITEECSQSQKAILSNANKLRKIQSLIKSMQYSSKKYFDEEAISKEILADNLQNEAEELLSTTVTLKLQFMNVRELRKLYNQNNKLIQALLVKYQGRYTTKANITIYKLMVIALEAELQNVLYNMRYAKLEKSINDIQSITSKYQNIAIEGNQSIATTVTKFIGEIEYLFIEAIKIEYEYYIQKERIKEEQKAIRDQMRQDAIERKKLEEERKKVEAEQTKYENEIMNIKEQLATADDALAIQQLEERIARIQAQLDEVEKKKEEITKLEHGKAGYVYILSNFGSFGDNTFKIGMTRRIDPLERVNELSGASVPFNYDVHSFIFSNDAPTLEYNLHKQMNNKRVNKVNLRREFFNATIDELEDLVYTLEPSAEFNRTMQAEQYYQSMTVNEIPDNVTIIDDDNMDDDKEE
jgi:hypothetical protein